MPLIEEVEEATKRKNPAGPLWHTQIFALIPIFVLQFTYGMNSGYPAILTPQLQEGCSEFQVTDDEVSWIVSLENVTSAFACILSGFLQHKFGPKTVLIIGCFPYILGWVLAAVANSVPFLYVSRLVVGASHACVTTTVYTAEVASKEWRGTFSLWESVTRCLGCLTIYILGAFFRWNTIATFAPAAPLAALIVAFFIPESPIYLVRFEKETKAAKALEQLYGSQYDSLSEVSIIKRNLEELNREHSMNNNTSLADKFKINARKSEIYKPFLVLVTLTLVQQFSGMTVLRSYVVIIFDNIFNPDGDLNPPPDSSNSTTTTTTVVDSTTSSYSGSTGDCDNHHDTTSRYAYLSAVLIALVRLVSSLLLSKLLRNYRRRTMYMFSSSVTILALLSFATATLLLDRDISSALATAMTWTSLAAACLLVFGVQLGIQTLPNLLSGELFPSDLRAWCKSISRCITSIFIVVVVKAFPALVRAIEIYGTFYLFAVITALSLPLVYYVMPETMNLSLECIQKYFLPQRTVFYIDLEEPEGEGEEEEEEEASKANGPQ